MQKVLRYIYKQCARFFPKAQFRNPSEKDAITHSQATLPRWKLKSHKR